MQERGNVMAGKNTAAYGIYRDRQAAERAVDDLRADGFRTEDISVLFPDNQGSKDFAHEKHTKAPEGTATGATTGGVVGGTLGLLAGIGVLAIPGVGPFIAAGPIMSALAGLGVGGAVGGMIGALVGMGIPEYEAKRYEGRIREGGVLLSVHCDNSEWVGRAKDSLKQTGAEHIASAGEGGADFAQSDKPMPRHRAPGAYEDDGRGERQPEQEVQRMAAGSSRPVGDYEYDTDFRRDHETLYQGRGLTYEQCEPAYRFGSVCAENDRYRDSDWQAAEPELRRSWEGRRHGVWEDSRDAIRYGWDRVRSGRR
jgi:hypothetical protein